MSEGRARCAWNVEPWWHGKFHFSFQRSMMKLQFLIVLICFFETSGNESFIKTAKGNIRIKCKLNYVLMTNASKLFFKFNGKTSFLINSSHGVINYVCIKKEFYDRQCRKVTGKTILNTTDCYVGNENHRIKLNLPEKSKKYFHFLILHSSLWAEEMEYPAFSNLMWNGRDVLTIDKNIWFFLKVSNKKEEDFGELVTEHSREPVTWTKKDEISTSTTVATTEKNIFTTNDEISSSTIIATEEKTLSPNNVFIIFGTVVIILLIIIFLLVGFIFYRKRLMKETITTMNENHLGENETIGQMPDEGIVTDQTFMKTVKGVNQTIECKENSHITTNASEFITKCSAKQSCLINSQIKTVHFICVKREFYITGSKCRNVNEKTYLNTTGCYVGNEREKIKLYLPEEPTKHFHFLILRRSLWIGEEHHSAFYYLMWNRKDDLTIDGSTWFYLKVSNKKTEDFGEFVTGSSRHLIRRNLKLFIILGAVVIVLLIIFLLAAFIFYRHRKSKRTQNTETANRTNEIPPGENGDNSDYEVIPEDAYGIPQGENEDQATYDNNEYDSISGFIYVNPPRIHQVRPVGPKYPSSIYMNVQGAYQATTSENKEYDVISEDVYINQKEIYSNNTIDPEDSSPVYLCLH